MGEITAFNKSTGVCAQVNWKNPTFLDDSNIAEDKF